MTTIENGTPRHVQQASLSTGKLAVRWLLTFRWHLLLLFLSDLGRAIITSKYDAFTTDAAYETTPSGRGALGRFVDRVVRNTDTHVALRQRLDLIIDEIIAAALTAHQGGDGQVRLVSGPCGLARDLRRAWARLDEEGHIPEGWLEVIGLDLDFSGGVLDEASRQAALRGVPLQTFQRDLLEPGPESPIRDVDIFVSMGLSTWLDRGALDRLLAMIAGSLAPGGVLLIDNWRPHRGARYVDTFQLPARYPSDDEFEQTLADAGFAIEAKRVSANEVVVVYRARAVSR